MDKNMTDRPAAPQPQPEPPAIAKVLDELLVALASEFGENCFCEIDGHGSHAPNCPRKRAYELLQSGVAPQPLSAPPWISVETRLPAPSSMVLFWTRQGSWESGIFRADDNEPVRWECERTGPQDTRIDFHEGEVTHWMIPDPPGVAPQPLSAPEPSDEDAVRFLLKVGQYAPRLQVKFLKNFVAKWRVAAEPLSATPEPSNKPIDWSKSMWCATGNHGNCQGSNRMWWECKCECHAPLSATQNVLAEEAMEECEVPIIGGENCTHQNVLRMAEGSWTCGDCDTRFVMAAPLSVTAQPQAKDKNNASENSELNQSSASVAGRAHCDSVGLGAKPLADEACNYLQRFNLPDTDLNALRLGKSPKWVSDVMAEFAAFVAPPSSEVTSQPTTINKIRDAVENFCGHDWPDGKPLPDICPECDKIVQAVIGTFLASPSLAEEAQPDPYCVPDDKGHIACPHCRVAEEAVPQKCSATLKGDPPPKCDRKFGHDGDHVAYVKGGELAWHDAQKYPDVCPRCGSTDPVARRQTVGSPERSCWPGSMDHDAWHDAKPAESQQISKKEN